MNPSSSAPAPANPRPRRNSRHWLLWLGGVLLIGLLVYGLWPSPEPVETAITAIGKLRTTVNEEGRTRIRRRFVVSAPVAGQLRRIALKPGDAVTADATVVAVIDPLSPTLLDARTRRLAEARRDTAAANLGKAKAAQVFAQSELRRFEKLFKEGTVSAQELEGTQWREAAASRDETASASALRQAEAELAEFSPGQNDAAGLSRPPVEVPAPASGKVLRVIEENARVVGAGAALLEIGDATDLEVVIDVLSRDGAATAPGTRVELEQWGGSQPLEAKVRLVEPAAFTKVSALGVEEQRVNVIADLVTPPAQRPSLGDNFRVEARIVTWEADQALKVPAGALFRRGQDWAAFILTAGRAQLRVVKVGHSSGAETQILDGLREGETVILYPGDRIRAGQRVRPVTI